jgi:hypothetical protein
MAEVGVGGRDSQGQFITGKEHYNRSLATRKAISIFGSISSVAQLCF